MVKKLDPEKINEIYEAHNLGVSASKAAEIVGVSVTSVKNYWKHADLKAHFIDISTQLVPEKIQMIMEAYEIGMSSYGAARYVGVSESTITRHWKNAGLELKYRPQQFYKATITELLDNVFDTRDGIEEELTLEQIAQKIRHKKPVDKKDLRKKVKNLVNVGCYEVITRQNKDYYKPGMPMIMSLDGKK